jgi:hypothetical protein
MEIGPSVLIVVVLSETRRCEAAGFDRVLYCLAAAEVVGARVPLGVGLARMGGGKR